MSLDFKTEFTDVHYFTISVNEAFLMVAREINNKFEAGVLQLADGWDGIKQ
jgi:hypothetical protein